MQRGRMGRRGGQRPRRGPLGLWMRACVIVIRPLVRVFFRFRWLGAEHVPRSGAAIVMANHVSLLDPLVLARFVYDAGRIPRFLIKSSLFGLPGVGAVLRGAQQIPVSRGTATATDALGAAEAALTRGEVIIVYPEGTVTRDPLWWPMQARTGVARLALAMPSVPVIPVAQWGAQRAWDYHTKKLRLLPRTPVVVQAGPALDLRPYAGRPATPELLHEVTDRAFALVRGMLGQLRGQRPPVDIWPGVRRALP